MFGKNKILAPKKSNGNSLDVQEIFCTFQGEGLFTGQQAIFIRLGGCNLACEFCDTEFDSYHELSLEKILSEVEKLSNNQIKLVVITGGEPLRQNILPLCNKLIGKDFKIQIETNGTLFQELPDDVTIICSPKSSNNKYYKIRDDLLPKITAFKFLISKNNPNYNEICEVGQSKFNIPVYLQPIDEYDADSNLQNRELTLELARKYNYRISLQTQKFWKIR